MATHRLGRLKCLRQEYLCPGESYDVNIEGSIAMTQLRERMSVDIHVGIYAFFTPMRYLVDDWTDRVQAKTSVAWPAYDTTELPVPATTRAGSDTQYDFLGLGRLRPGVEIQDFWLANYGLIHQWYFLHPDDFDARFASPVTEAKITAAAAHALSGNSEDNAKFGLSCLHLDSLLTRFRANDAVEPNTGRQVTVPSTSSLDLRDLAEEQYAFKSDQIRDWLINEDKYGEVLSEIWNTKSKDNVDQIPFMIHEHTQWLSGANIYATDASNLGSSQGVMSAMIDHSLGSFRAMEHGVISYFMVIRTPPIFESERSPFISASLGRRDWLVEPDYAAQERPQSWNPSVAQDITASDVGYYPTLQIWRKGYNHIDQDIQVRDSFPVFRDGISTPEDRYYIQDIDHMFTSASLAHAQSQIKISQMVSSPIPAPFGSIMMGDDD